MFYQNHENPKLILNGIILSLILIISLATFLFLAFEAGNLLTNAETTGAITSGVTEYR